MSGNKILAFAVLSLQLMPLTASGSFTGTPKEVVTEINDGQKNEDKKTQWVDLSQEKAEAVFSHFTLDRGAEPDPDGSAHLYGQYPAVCTNKDSVGSKSPFPIAVINSNSHAKDSVIAEYKKLTDAEKVKNQSSKKYPSATGFSIRVTKAFLECAEPLLKQANYCGEIGECKPLSKLNNTSFKVKETDQPVLALFSRDTDRDINQPESIHLDKTSITYKSQKDFDNERRAQHAEQVIQYQANLDNCKTLEDLPIAFRSLNWLARFGEVSNEEKRDQKKKLEELKISLEGEKALKEIAALKDKIKSAKSEELDSLLDQLNQAAEKITGAANQAIALGAYELLADQALTLGKPADDIYSAAEEKLKDLKSADKTNLAELKKTAKNDTDLAGMIAGDQKSYDDFAKRLCGVSYVAYINHQCKGGLYSAVLKNCSGVKSSQEACTVALNDYNALHQLDQLASQRRQEIQKSLNASLQSSSNPGSNQQFQSSPGYPAQSSGFQTAGLPGSFPGGSVSFNPVAPGAGFNPFPSTQQPQQRLTSFQTQ